MKRLALGIVLASGVLHAAPLAYPWLPSGSAGAQALSQRILPPEGYMRVALPRDHFGAWLRELPLEPDGAKVHLFDGTDKPNQRVHAAVVRLDVGKRDLQQCADAVMRLRAEYLLAKGELIEFHPDRKRVLRFDPRTPDPGRKHFAHYLVQVFAEAGTASLQAELPRATGLLIPGDVLIQGGSPGHAVLVLDVVANAEGQRRVLLGQSYMPAQEFHVLRNLADGRQGPWFDEAALDSKLGLITPEWRPFHRADVRRFP